MSRITKLFKIIYYIFLGLIVVVALLLVFSVFPITGNYKIFIVQSGSMAPAIKMGSIVVVKPAENYKIGEVITFGSYTKLRAPTTHRIYEIKVVNSQPLYITKGDANNAPDPREISKEEIIGKVLFSIPYLGFAVDFAKKPLGFALIIIFPAVVIIIDEIKNIYNEIKKKKEKEK
jgi:signal peptidase